METLCVYFSLSNPIVIDVPVMFSLSGTSAHSATLGTDVGTIDDTNNTAIILAGDTIGTFSIPITSDTEREGGESFTFSISALGAVIASGDVTKTINIIDDESPKIDITADSFLFAEDNGTFSGNLIIDGTFPQAFTFDLEIGVTGDTATFNSDYQRRVVNNQVISNSTTLVQFAQNTTSVAFSIDMINDMVVEENESITLKLSNLSSAQVQFPNGGRSYSKTITIVDDDSVTLSVKNTRFSVNENVGLGGFILRLGLSQASEADVSVEYEVDHIDPNTMSDLSVPALRKVIIPAGETLGTFTITINDDSEKEGNETFRIILKDPIGAGHVSGNDTHNVDITIVDDEYPTVHLPANKQFFSEGAGETEITVVLEGASTRLIAVSYETVDSESVDNFAIAGEDYTHQQGVLNFSPGTIEQKITIPIIDDNVAEVSEQFNINYAITIGDTEIHDSNGSTTGSRRVWIQR